MTTDGLTRRHALQGAALVGVGAPVLAACGSDTASDSGDGSGTEAGATIRCRCHGSQFSATDGSVVQGPASGALEEKDVTVTGGEVEVDGEVVGEAADVPEGGGAIFADSKVVVTQVTAGDYRAFTAVCTHQGCIVSSVES
jgi:nitrite reductase/ring-hydroxylating ferredoxin subunit